jgi:hypothetical protein
MGGGSRIFTLVNLSVLAALAPERILCRSGHTAGAVTPLAKLKALPKVRFWRDIMARKYQIISFLIMF